jgi:hypothetical protein
LFRVEGEKFKNDWKNEMIKKSPDSKTKTSSHINVDQFWIEKHFVNI